eukprot:3712481-Pleurochrysis_carterae.AAC.1
MSISGGQSKPHIGPFFGRTLKWYSILIGPSVSTPLATPPMVPPFAFSCSQARGGEGDRGFCGLAVAPTS